MKTVRHLWLITYRVIFITLVFFSFPSVLWAVDTGVQLPSANPLDRLQASPYKEVRWIKFQYSWAAADQPVDAWVNRAHQAGYSVLLSVTKRPEGGTYQSYKEFMQNLAQRMGNKVQAYEIWNEPNIAEEWTNVGWGEISPIEYAQLLKYGAEGVKAGNSQAKVISAGLATNSPNELEFLDKYLAVADLSQVDYIGAHLNITANIPPQDSNDQGFQRIKYYLDKGKPVWVTEFGWAKDAAGISSQTQANYINEAIKTASSLVGVEGMVIWNFGFGRENPQFSEWDIDNSLPASSLNDTEISSNQKRVGKEEQAIYYLNRGELPKEVIETSSTQNQGFLQNILKTLSSLFSNLVSPAKFFSQSESRFQAIVPSEVKPSENQLENLWGGSTGVYGVSLPKEIQDTNVQKTEQNFEKAYFPEGVNPITR